MPSLSDDIEEIAYQSIVTFEQSLIANLLVHERGITG